MNIFSPKKRENYVLPFHKALEAVWSNNIAQPLMFWFLTHELSKTFASGLSNALREIVKYDSNICVEKAINSSHSIPPGILQEKTNRIVWKKSLLILIKGQSKGRSGRAALSMGSMAWDVSSDETVHKQAASAGDDPRVRLNADPRHAVSAERWLLFSLKPAPSESDGVSQGLNNNRTRNKDACDSQKWLTRTWRTRFPFAVRGIDAQFTKLNKARVLNEDKRACV